MAGRKSANVREIEILSDQESFSLSNSVPYRLIIAACKAFVSHRVDVMTKVGQGSDEPLGQILVELELHRLTWAPATGRSS